MTLFKNRYRIESARLKGYDYARPGKYFVTICTKSMAELFGEVNNGVMSRNQMGKTAHQAWIEIPQHHNNVTLDEFIVMPNHVHGIVVLGGNLCGDVARNVSPRNKQNPMSRISPKRGTLGSVVRSYKSAVTNWCHANGYDEFAWQPRFHDHIIRNEKELNAIRDYIRNNPANWQNDRNHPTGGSFAPL